MLSGTQFHQVSVGFSVRKTSTQVLLPSDIVSFDDIVYNDGNGYNTSLNHYICPQNGIYYTYFTSWKTYENNLYVGIEKNSIMELHIEDSQGSQNGLNVMSNSYINYCEAGERLVVRATRAGMVYSDTLSKVPTFSGMLMLGTGNNFIYFRYTPVMKYAN